MLKEFTGQRSKGTLHATWGIAGVNWDFAWEGKAYWGTWALSSILQSRRDSLWIPPRERVAINWWKLQGNRFLSDYKEQLCNNQKYFTMARGLTEGLSWVPAERSLVGNITKTMNILDRVWDQMTFMELWDYVICDLRFMLVYLILNVKTSKQYTLCLSPVVNISWFIYLACTPISFWKCILPLFWGTALPANLVILMGTAKQSTLPLASN